MKRLAALLTLAVLSLAAWAADPPGRVARLSLVEGEAAVFVDPEAGWEGARINSHLTSENSVWTEPGARAEVRFGSTALRLGEATQLDILRLDDASFRAHVARGTLAVRIRDFDRSESFVVTTPEGRFHFRGNGRFRLDADPARGESILTAFSGTAQVEAPGGSINVDTGRSVRVTGGESPRFAFETAYSTSLDEWALARDQRWEERESLRYVPREMTGWEDLDDYGTWRNDPEYGAVWYPTRVAAGWAPYRYGRWTWVRPWGWAWVDDAPWGYAPFHYGRWVYVGNRWGWYPGRYTARPVWAPALVGWVGAPGWSISISGGYTNVMGWYPLSPYDNYQPWYTNNVTYVNYVNRIVLPPRHRRDHQYDRDRRHDHREIGATVVPRDQFGTHRPVQNIRTTVPGEAVVRQPIAAGNRVLPPRPEPRPQDRPPRTSPPATSAGSAVMPSTGRPAPAPRPVFPAESAAGTPPTRQPAPSQPAPPVSRQPQSAPAAPVARPKPVAPVEQSSQPVVRPKPVAPAEQSAQPAVRPKPVPPAQQSSQPAVRSKPVAPVEQSAQPAVRSKPSAPVERVPQPASRPAPAPQSAPSAARPAPAAPAARPAPAEKPDAPARGGEAPGQSGEKPGKGSNK